MFGRENVRISSMSVLCPKIMSSKVHQIICSAEYFSLNIVVCVRMSNTVRRSHAETEYYKSEDLKSKLWVRRLQFG